MNKTAIFLLALLPALFASHIFTVEVDRSGTSSVTLSMEGNDTVNISLPSDASSIRVVGGSYGRGNGSVVVHPGQSGFTTFSFTTDLFTEKTSTGWKLAFSPPAGAIVRVSMPAYSTLDNSFPQPKTVSAEQSRTILDLDYSNLVTVYYRLGEQPKTEPADQQSLYMIVALIAVAAVLSFLVLRKGGDQLSPGPTIAPSAPAERPPTLDMTPGKKEMMETFNENDVKIVNALFGKGGRMRRNELERQSGISKSSLAMALNRLEKRKIVEIDRTATTHFVKLSEYFLRL
ncbi:MAG: hypothetical protein U0R44_04725 [Candidatus Micrarchaeia archaeon]